jgi:signal transduction histidine kinase
LTNARKHAPSAVVSVAIDGAPGDRLEVEIVSRRPLAQLGLPEIPGGGAGLIGLGERVSLAGGRLEHGRSQSGDYRLWAWLPWPA